MKHWILAAATLFLIQGADAREHWGPPPLCPQPKADCCPKPKCPPAETKQCAPKQNKPKPCPPKECKPKPCEEACPKPCCPPVCFERGMPTSPCCTPTAYSEPAAIDLKCGWDVFMTANFIYWEAIQGGMDLAIPGQGTITSGVLTAGSVAQSAGGFSVLQQDFSYKPGFQVGLGWSGMKDNWVLYSQYTWLHGSTNTSATAQDPAPLTVRGSTLPVNGLWLPSSWFTGVYTNDATTQISSSWNYRIDLLDGQLSRPFYSGARFTVEPFFGLRGAWIRQNLNLTAANQATSTGAAGSSRQAHYSSRSAAVGPRIGMNGNWHLGYGLKFLGNAAASLLFTNYDVKQNVASPDLTGTVFPVKTQIDDLNVLRPNLDLGLGLGWGSYLNCRRFYLDLSATYDFSIFWEQNMMRYLADLTADNAIHTNGSASDLYLHGLTIKTRFDF